MPLTSVVSPTTSGAVFLQSTHPTTPAILEVYAAVRAGARVMAKSSRSLGGPRLAAPPGGNQPARSR